MHCNYVDDIKRIINISSKTISWDVNILSQKADKLILILIFYLRSLLFLCLFCHDFSTSCFDFSLLTFFKFRKTSLPPIRQQVLSLSALR